MNAHLSPSLTSSSEPAYELKFLIGEQLVDPILKWAVEHLEPDPFMDSPTAGYATRTLYLDTIDKDVIARSSGFRVRKYRVRQYATSDLAFLEEKTRRGSRVAKRRTPIGSGELEHLSGPLHLQDWAAAWFHEKVAAKSLTPSMVGSYRRLAFIAGNSRLTLDREIESSLQPRWIPHHDLKVVRSSRTVLELKFNSALPVLFRTLVADYGLIPTSFSKYRTGFEACKELRCQTG